MSDIKVILTDLSEFTTRDIARKEKPKGLEENLNVARRGGKVSKIARVTYEVETGNSAITSTNKIEQK